MKSEKNDWSAVVKVFGWLLGLAVTLKKLAAELGVPFEAFLRLTTDKGETTLRAIVQLVLDEYSASLPKPPAMQGGAHHDASSGGQPFRGTLMTDARNVIEVPDLDAVDLTALTESHCNLTFLDGDYERWDFYRGVDGNSISGRGKRFEFMTWEPKRRVSSKEVREYFQAKGFSGHTGAFTAWVKERKPQGYHASIPDDNGCWRHSDGRLFVPCSCFDGGHRELRHGWLDVGWRGFWVFVAFRELP